MTNDGVVYTRINLANYVSDSYSKQAYHKQIITDQQVTIYVYYNI